MARLIFTGRGLLMDVRLVLSYLPGALLAFISGIGLDQYIFGPTKTTRGVGGMLFFLLGGLAMLGYSFLLRGMRSRHGGRGEPFVWARLTGTEKMLVIAWPIAFVTGFGIALVV